EVRRCAHFTDKSCRIRSTIGESSFSGLRFKKYAGTIATATVPTDCLRGCAHARGRARDGIKLRVALAVDLLLRVGLLDVDATLEEGTVFDADALRNDVTGERAFVADVNAI